MLESERAADTVAFGSGNETPPGLHCDAWNEALWRASVRRKWMDARAEREVSEIIEEVDGVITHLTTEYGPEASQAFIRRLIERCGGGGSRRVGHCGNLGG